MKHKYDMLNCPFCGGKPYLERSHRAFVKGQTTRVAFVRCLNCNARSPRFSLLDFGCTSTSHEAEKAAVGSWNIRFCNCNRKEKNDESIR